MYGAFYPRHHLKLYVDMISAELIAWFDAMYGDADIVRVAIGGTRFKNQGVRGRDLRRHVDALDAAGTANIYVGIAAHDTHGAPAWDASTIVSARAFCLDVDYGTVGHRTTTPFRTAAEALSYIRTLPLAPHAIWSTGHGFQAAFFLDSPMDLRTAAAKEIYAATARGLGRIALSDHGSSPADLIRVPCTLNVKPDCSPIPGAFVDTDRLSLHISLAELQAFVGTVAAATADTEDDAEPEAADPMSGTETVRFDQLSADLQAYIRDGHDDRSAAMFAAVASIVREARGIAPASVIDCIRSGPAFREKYGSRLAKEVRRCLRKIEIADAAEDVPSTFGIRPSTDIALRSCRPLPPALEATVRAAVACRGIEDAQRIVDTATYMHEIISAHCKAVIEAPCGSGKTTVAAAIAIHRARARKRTAIVVATVDDVCTLYTEVKELAAATSTVVSIGVHHGFRPEFCERLTGTARTWQQCILRDPAAACHSCAANTKCSYYCRDRALKDAEIVIMPHAGFITILERTPTAFRNRLVIVDEDPQIFCGLDLSPADLELAGYYLRRDGDAAALSALFPGCGLHLQSIPGCPVDRGGVYATRNYVAYSRADLDRIRAVLRRIRARMFADPRRRLCPPQDYMLPAESEHAEDVLLGILQFFRGTALEANFVCHIQNLAEPGTVSIRKRRIGPHGFPKNLKVVILNGSAGCSRVRTPEDMPVCRCPDLVRPMATLGLTVVHGNPMRSRLVDNMNAGLEGLRRLGLRPRNVLVVTAATEDPADYRKCIKEALPDATIMHLTRGRTRGTNVARSCDLLFLPGMPLFTTIPECAMAAALELGKTIPVTALLDDAGKPAMSAGAFRFVPVQREYMRGALDELYQALYRGSLRDGLGMDAVVVLPHASWLSALWDLGLQGFHFRCAVPATGKRGRRLAAFAGLCRILWASAGTELPKTAVAECFGFPTWKAAKRTVLPLIDRYVTVTEHVVVRNSWCAMPVEPLDLV